MPAICSALGTLILVVIIILCIPMSLPRLFGYGIYTVISGSMEPAIPTGSLVYVDRSQADSAEVGDVVAYYGSGNDVGTVITHRVVAIDEEDKLVTKGDANNTEDLIPVSRFNVIGKVVFHIPAIGWLASFVSTLAGKFAVGLAVIAAMIFYVVAAILRPQAD